MKSPRLALISSVLVASTVLVATQSHAVTSAPPTGLPLYQFSETGTGTFPWSAASLEAKLNATTMLGGPHGDTDASEGVLAYRTNEGELALYVQTDAGNTAWRNYSAQGDVPAPADDPIPLFDPSGNVDLLYVDTSGEAILVSPNEPDSPAWAKAHYGTPWTKYVATNLSALTGVSAATGLPSAQVTGQNGVVAYRTTSDQVEVVSLSWQGTDPLPIYDQSAASVNYQGIAVPVANVRGRTSHAGTTTTTTTTTQPKATTTTTTKPTTTTTQKSTTTTTTPTVASAFESDPVVLPGATPASRRSSITATSSWTPASAPGSRRGRARTSRRMRDRPW